MRGAGSLHDPPGRERTSLQDRLSRLSEQQREALRHRVAVRRPASWVQFGVWLNEQLAPGTADYLNPSVLRLDGPLDEVALATALATVAARHEPLRSTFESDEDGRLWALVRPPGSARPALRTVDVRDAADPAAEADRLVQEASFTPFELSHGPLWRSLLVRRADDEHLLAVSLHHIVSDGGTLGVLMRELLSAYPALAAGRPAELPALPVSYHELTAARERQVDPATLAYWVRQLAGAPRDVDLRPLLASTPGDPGSHDVPVPDALRDRLRPVLSGRSASEFAGLLAAFAIALRLATGQTVLALTTPVDTRESQGAQLVGCFVNNVVLRLGMTDGEPVGDIVAAAGRAVTEAMTHSQVPFGRVMAAVGGSRNAGQDPFGRVGVVHNNAPLDRLGLPGLTVTRHPLPIRHFQHDLALTVSRGPDGLEGRLDHGGALDPVRVRALAESWLRILATVADAPATPVGAADPVTTR